MPTLRGIETLGTTAAKSYALCSSNNLTALLDSLEYLCFESNDRYCLLLQDYRSRENEDMQMEENFEAS